MPKLTRSCGLIFAFVALAAVVQGEVKVASIFQDHAVLQRDLPVPVWGSAEPGETVTVAFGGQAARATADGAGHWRVTLRPMSASATPADLVVTAGNAVTLHDLVVGEVWLCSGQSNMEWNVARAFAAEHEMAAAKFPLIRAIKVGVASVMPPATAIARGTWKVCSPETVGGFTAVGYHFARELHEALGVPVGIIDATWGGTAIEAWMSEEALLSDPAFASVFQKWGEQIATLPQRRAAWQKRMDDWMAAAAAAKARGETYARSEPVPFWGLEERVRPMGLFGGMIAPLLPYGIRGAAWYQGENNAGQDNYEALLRAMIADWRRQWGEGAFPFFVVQLPNYAAGNPAGLAWAKTREAQARAVKATPNAALAVTIDVGDPATVHPLRKREVGRRLALHALAQVHGRAVEAEGPVVAAVTFDRAAVTVGFEHAEGLHSSRPAVPGFELAGEDRKFVAATGRIAGRAVIVENPTVTHPVAVRYAWRNAPETDLANSAGLPAAPFRSDDW